MCIFSDRFLSILPDPRFAIPGTSPHYAPDRNFKTEHMKLEFSFDIKKKAVSGRATASIRLIAPADSIVFDAAGMAIVSVKNRNGETLKFDQGNSQLTVHLGKKAAAGTSMDIAMEYKITDPKLGIYFVGPDKAYPKKPVQIWTHSEAEEARYWFPCHDSPHEKFTAEMQLTVPQEFFALSNGILTKTDAKKPGTKTYHWKMNFPIPSYLMMFAVGKFSEIRDEWDGIPVLYYCEKGREGDAKRAFGKTPKMLEFFSKKIGVRYPFDKYAQVAVADFVFGGMEHTTATTQTDAALVDEKASQEYDWNDMLTAHELAHQWFGDMLTCKDWSHAWLNESFATYFEALFMEHDKGKDEFEYEMYGNAKSYFSEDKDRYRRPIVTNIYAEPGDLFDRHLYEKGALVLHMVRNILGDEAWWKAVCTYAERKKNSVVETEDLVQAIEDATGRNMRKFFDQWVYGAGHPELKTNYYWDDKTKEAVIRVAQVQRTDDQTPLFSLPLAIEVITKEGPKRFLENFEEKQKQFRYKLQVPPIDVRIDPENFLLRKLDFSKPKDMWLFQLENDPSTTGRIYAAQELAKIGTNDVVASLGRQLASDKFWGVQAEIALALSTIRSDAALRALCKLSDTKNLRLKRYIAFALGEFKSAPAFEALKKMIADKSSYLVPMAAARSIGRTGQDAAMQELKKTLFIQSWNDVIKAGALDGIGQLSAEQAVPLLKMHAQAGYNERSRMAAIRSLGGVGKNRKDVLDFLLDMTKDPYTLVVISAVSALGDLGDERAIPRLDELSRGTRDGRIKRQSMEAIRKIYVWLDTDLETAEMKDRYEKMKKEVESRKKPS